MKYPFSLLIFILAFSAFAQPSVRSLNAYLEGVRNGSYDPVPEEMFVANLKNQLNKEVVGGDLIVNTIIID